MQRKPTRKIQMIILNLQMRKLRKLTLPLIPGFGTHILIDLNMAGKRPLLSRKKKFGYYLFS
jgi:hypothetical protein